MNTEYLHLSLHLFDSLLTFIESVGCFSFEPVPSCEFTIQASYEVVELVIELLVELLFHFSQSLLYIRLKLSYILRSLLYTLFCLFEFFIVLVNRLHSQLIPLIFHLFLFD